MRLLHSLVWIGLVCGLVGCCPETVKCTRVLWYVDAENYLCFQDVYTSEGRAPKCSSCEMGESQLFWVRAGARHSFKPRDHWGGSVISYAEWSESLGRFVLDGHNGVCLFDADGAAAIGKSRIGSRNPFLSYSDGRRLVRSAVGRVSPNGLFYAAYRGGNRGMDGLSVPQYALEIVDLTQVRISRRPASDAWGLAEVVIVSDDHVVATTYSGQWIDARRTPGKWDWEFTSKTFCPARRVIGVHDGKAIYQQGNQLHVPGYPSITVESQLPDVDQGPSCETSPLPGIWAVHIKGSQLMYLARADGFGLMGNGKVYQVDLSAAEPKPILRGKVFDVGRYGKTSDGLWVSGQRHPYMSCKPRGWSPLSDSQVAEIPFDAPIRWVKIWQGDTKAEHPKK